MVLPTMSDGTIFKIHFYKLKLTDIHEFDEVKDTITIGIYMSLAWLDDRIIRTDWDAGFIEGRQYGRGKSGGQVRDEYRTDFDSGRGGYGKIVQQKLEVVDYLI